MAVTYDWSRMWIVDNPGLEWRITDGLKVVITSPKEVTIIVMDLVLLFILSHCKVT
jgi:hypothetical protein